MLRINNFGRSFVVEKESNIVLLITRSNEVAKFVTSSILDTLTMQLSDHHLSSYSKEYFDDSTWLKTSKGGFLTLHQDTSSEETIRKKKLAKWRSEGYYLLAEQATIIGCSYDDLADLNTDDLPLFLLNKELYVQQYAVNRGMSHSSAEKHLVFLCDSLLAANMRRQTLMWKYTGSLKAISSYEDLTVWKDDVLRETIGVGEI